MHKRVGNAFQITMPVFQPAVVVGPETNRQVLVTEREDFLWRSEMDPVTKLLRHGVLVVDGEEHDVIRAQLDPPMQRRQVVEHLDAMWRYTNDIIENWDDGGVVDMLVEMRKVALLILIGTTFKVEFGPDLKRMWEPILKLIKYISPGLWILWPNMPRPGYGRAQRQMDEYLYGIIQQRRTEIAGGAVVEPSDLLGNLILAPEMNDDLIRDQLLTMLIAGHDTSTALLAGPCICWGHIQMRWPRLRQKWIR